MEARITTGKNFDFLQDAFIEAKHSLIDELRTGIEDPHRIKGVGLEGASRTGKTWDTCVFICHYVTTYQGKSITISRDHLAKLKKTTYKTFQTVWNLFGLPMSHINKSATDIHYNGNIITFVGINDDLMVSHGLESDLLWINEAMGVAKETVDQLEQRTREFFIYDYNPSATEHYLFEKEKQNGYLNFKTTIFDNKYAPLNAKAKIISYAHPDVDDWEMIKGKINFSQEEWEERKRANEEKGTADKYMWEVYGLGKRAVGEDIIFTNWELYENEPEQLDWFLYGGDFGYKTDPTAYVKLSKKGNSIFIRQYIYETGLLNPEIATKVIELGCNDEISMWDTAEAKSIDELRLGGLHADGADKGVGSVVWGIQKLQQFKIYLHVDSKDLQSEFRKYRWAKDKAGQFKRNTLGKRVPVDKDNHLIDASRYAISRYLEPMEQE